MARVIKGKPADLGYWMPPEWYPHQATWISWPRPEGVSFPDRYHEVVPNLAAIVRRILHREEVHINVPNGNWQRIVRQQLRENNCPVRNIVFHHIRTNESWCRDHGPAFLLGRRRGDHRQSAIVDWKFNAWGGKYPPYQDDDDVPTKVAEQLRLPVFYPGIVMEGGAVDFNGAGTVMTTESCLLNRNRNPDLSRKQIEKYLKDYYGQRHVVWLGDGIAGDDTDGHIDDLARFIDPNTIVATVEEDPADENYKVLQDNLERLRAARDQDGQPFNIVEIPMPGTVMHNGHRLPATYANFYFISGALLVPTYRHRRNDQLAIEMLQKHLPRHKVVGIDCIELIWGLGAIHCLTQQQPRA
jgi:agmatine deiminase